jgi:hypothetical protein
MLYILVHNISIFYTYLFYNYESYYVVHMLIHIRQRDPCPNHSRLHGQIGVFSLSFLVARNKESEKVKWQKLNPCQRLQTYVCFVF